MVNHDASGPHQVEYVGDKAIPEMKKSLDSDEVQTYLQALQDMLKAIAIADSLGQSLKDYPAKAEHP